VGFPGEVIIYGANLMFVDMEQVVLYRLEIKGQRLPHVEYGMAGVGEEVDMLMRPDADGRGRVVTAVVPKNEVASLRAREHASLKLKLQQSAR
jgi:hypothetical protein